MWPFSARVADVSRLLDLITDLQREKREIRAERDAMRDKLFALMGLGSATYPTDAPSTPEPETDLTQIGKRVTLMGLRARAEANSRQQAKDKATELVKGRPNVS